MEELRQAMRGLKRGTLYESLALLLVGILFLVYPESSGTIICYVVGAVLCLWGLVRCVAYFRADRLVAFGSFGLVQGAALLAVGVFVLVRPEVLAGVLTSVFGILLIVDGVLKMQHAIGLARIQAAGWWAVGLAAATTAALGVVVLANPFKTAVTLMIFAGAALIAGSLLDLLTLAYVSRCVKAAKNAAEQAKSARARMDSAVDADYRDAEK